LEEYMREHILKPLGMNSTSYRLELRPDITMPLVETAQREDDGILQSSQKAWPDHAPEDCAGAGFYSSVPDYLKVLGDLIKDTPTLLSREIIEREMFAPQLWRDSLALRSLLSAPDLVSSMTGSTESGTGINHGLGGLYFGADIGNVKKGTLTWGWIAQSKVVQKLSRKGHCAVCYSADAPGDPVCAQVTRAFFDEVWRLTTR
jgi:CubicO group peptidase (beta-lactamase class C family)